MSMVYNILAKKYAIAFLNLYIKKLPVGEIERLTIFEDFLKKNRFFYISLQIPSIKESTKKLALSKIAENFQFKKPIVILMKTLLKAGRIEILDKVLKHIRFDYAKRTNMEFFRILTSHNLSISEKKIIVKLIHSLSKAKIRTKFEVDEKLIVGIRIESQSLLWERSIRKELIKVGKSLSKEGIQC